MPPASSAGLYPNRMRRALNVLVAAILLLLFLPLMLVIAALVKLTSTGPIFYMQTRVGIDRRRSRPPVQDGRRRIDYGGTLFTMYKFRTMYTDSDCVGEVWAQVDDPRVTPIGRVLRRYRLDELPQLVNVLLGDMNIVGPRPEQPKIFADLREQIERYTTRQRVLPGITGWAQINHHYDSSIDDVRRKLNFDLEYVERHCALEDLRIMLRTVPVIVFKRGGW
ncbi:MAG TPA: sugar transferase [Longimicrobiaceae bacterium]|nr:sugar transferase [Longimicrobiaceae bacterium]